MRLHEFTQREGGQPKSTVENFMGGFVFIFSQWRILKVTKGTEL